MGATSVTFQTEHEASYRRRLSRRAWNKAKVITVPKDGDHEQAENNRPISLLPVLSKICERAALDQLTPYLVLNKKLSTKQSGNKKFHSTETSLIKITDTILKAIDKKEITAVVLLDLSKALDSINHETLNKLRDIGLSCSSHSWFRSYLSDRYQMVRINSTLSDPLPVVSGVPQGSILGPILSSLYVDVLPLIPTSCKSECYVDYSKLYISFPINNASDTMMKINNGFVGISNWCFQNSLLLNPKKIKLMVNGSRQMLSNLHNFRVTLLGKEIQPSSCEKDLGVIFDQNLSFNEHITKTVSSCMSILGQINRVKHVFDRSTLIVIINTLVFTKMFCCSFVWSSTSGKNFT